MPIVVRPDDLRGPDVERLLQAHLQHAALHSPAHSIHALDIEALRAPDISFWAAWDGLSLLGCAALRELDRRHGEIKSMHTTEAHRRRGVGKHLLAHIIDEARRRGYGRLSLETGSMIGFAPARALYARFGFAFCDPFAGYAPDPNSVCMTLDLTASQRPGSEPLRGRR